VCQSPSRCDGQSEGRGEVITASGPKCWETTTDDAKRPVERVLQTLAQGYCDVTAQAALKEAIVVLDTPPLRMSLAKDCARRWSRYCAVGQRALPWHNRPAARIRYGLLCWWIYKTNRLVPQNAGFVVPEGILLQRWVPMPGAQAHVFPTTVFRTADLVDAFAALMMPVS